MDVIKCIMKLINDNKELKQKYNELIMEVSKKYPNESRHETALRYIRRMEESSTCGAQDNNHVK